MAGKKGVYERFLKRFLDVFCSLCGLIVLSPILIIVAVVVRFNLGSPIIFKQDRPGKEEKIFKLYKFRSMADKRDENGDYLPDVQRMTKFGNALRATSLDELPELVNIIKGDMSIVGPRPLDVKYLPYYNYEERKRHSVRPGLTGLAQINGRNTVKWEERFAYDIEYVNNITFTNDIRILLKTVEKVICKNDIGVAGVDRPESFHIYREKQLKCNK